MMRALLLTLTLFLFTGVAHAQNDWQQDVQPQDQWTRPGPVSPDTYNRQSLNSQPYDYSASGMDSGAEYCCDFSTQERAQERREQRQWRLQNLYQNQKPIACGPAFDPRAREGC